MQLQRDNESTLLITIEGRLVDGLQGYLFFVETSKRSIRGKKYRSAPIGSNFNYAIANKLSDIKVLIIRY